MKTTDRNRNSAAALMLSLWALFLLSAMVISWALNINSQIELSGNASRGLEAEAAACSGAEIALDPDVAPGDSVLRGQVAKNQTFDATITGEGGRINLNWIAAGENPQRIQILRTYLENKGVELNQCEHMIDCLLDYIDPDNIPRLNGAEADGNYQPKNALLQRVEELRSVKGWEDFTARPNWEADFTVYSSGPIDLRWASRDVLLALPGMNSLIVDNYLTYRRGPDGIDGTPDDPVFDSVDPQIRVALGLTPDQFAALSGLVANSPDPVQRVVSTGKSGDVTRTVQLIVRKAGLPQLIVWKEL